MSRVFGLLVAARGKLYDQGLLPVRKLNHPVISIGNVTSGGTGKTPLTLLLAEALRDEGFRPVVLSRGYRRKSSGIVVVSAGQGPLVSWDDAGDEPFLLARRAAGVSVVVGADRYTSGRFAESQNLGNVFLLDDGFQHRHLFRNVDLVAIDPVEWAAGEQLFPFGRWREPASAIQRAHAAVIQSGGPPVGHLPIPSFFVDTMPEGIFMGRDRIAVETLQGEPITAFAGIAKPDRFFRTLEALKIPVSRTFTFRDHHPYSNADLASLGEGLKITTEKDAVKLEAMGAVNLLHLRISAQLPALPELLKLIRERLSQVDSYRMKGKNAGTRRR